MLPVLIPAQSAFGQRKPQTVRVASPGESAGFGPVWLARDAGLFAKNGLGVDFVTTIQPVSVLLSGESEFVLSSGNPPAAARVAGAEVVIVMGIVNSSTFSLLVSRGIRHPADLRGKAVGVSTIGAATDMQLRRALRTWGMVPQRDVAILSTGGQYESLLALKHAKVEASVVDLFYAVTGRLRFGFTEMEGVRGFKDLPSSVSTRMSYLQSHEAIVRRFLEGCLAGIHLFKARKPLAIESLGRQLKTQDREILEAVYERLLPNIEELPYPSLDAVQAILTELAERNPKAKELKPEELVDSRIAKEIVGKSHGLRSEKRGEASQRLQPERGL
jgi:ABC-type nitrate/sulfonate/bicarbonate transport system substrate-binding protein